MANTPLDWVFGVKNTTWWSSNQGAKFNTNDDNGYNDDNDNGDDAVDDVIDDDYTSRLDDTNINRIVTLSQTCIKFANYFSNHWS